MDKWICSRFCDAKAPVWETRKNNARRCEQTGLPQWWVSTMLSVSSVVNLQCRKCRWTPGYVVLQKAVLRDSKHPQTERQLLYVSIFISTKTFKKNEDHRLFISLKSSLISQLVCILSVYCYVCENSWSSTSFTLLSVYHIGVISFSIKCSDWHHSALSLLSTIKIQWKWLLSCILCLSSLMKLPVLSYLCSTKSLLKRHLLKINSVLSALFWLRCQMTSFTMVCTHITIDQCI